MNLFDKLGGINSFLILLLIINIPRMKIVMDELTPFYNRNNKVRSENIMYYFILHTKNTISRSDTHTTKFRAVCFSIFLMSFTEN
jgi:dipeptidase